MTELETKLDALTEAIEDVEDVEGALHDAGFKVAAAVALDGKLRLRWAKVGKDWCLSVVDDQNVATPLVWSLRAVRIRAVLALPELYEELTATERAQLVPEASRTAHAAHFTWAAAALAVADARAFAARIRDARTLSRATDVAT